MLFFCYTRKLLLLSVLLLFTSSNFAQSIEAIDGETDKSVFYKLNKGIECVFVHDNVLVITKGRLVQVDSTAFRLEDAVGQYVIVPISRVVRLKKCSCRPREQRNSRWPDGYQTIPGPPLTSTQQSNKMATRLSRATLGSAVLGVNPAMSAMSALKKPQPNLPPAYKYWEFIAHPEPN